MLPWPTPPPLLFTVRWARSVTGTPSNRSRIGGARLSGAASSSGCLLRAILQRDLCSGCSLFGPFTRRAALVFLFVLCCLKCDANPPGTDISVSIYLVGRSRAPAIQIPCWRAWEHNIVKADRMCTLRRTKANARPFPFRCARGLEDATVCGRHEAALTTGEWSEWRRNQVVGIARRRKNVRGGAFAMGGMRSEH